MNRRDASRALAVLPLVAARPAFAQAPAAFRVAWVSTERRGLPSVNLDVFRAGMREAGYVEGRDLVVDVWAGDGSGPRVTEMVPDILRSKPDIIVAAGGLMMGFAGRVAAFSLQHRIPAVDGWAQFAEQGNLMTYGPVLSDVYRRLATHVDRIRKGAKPGDLPVELPTKLEFVINAKTANALGIAIPPGMLVRADVVIR